MRSEVKELWVNALNSGEYRQGVGALHDNSDNCYCVLGVLCDLAVKNGVGVWDGTKFVSGFSSSFIHPTLRVLEWADLTESDVTRLIHLNDRNLRTFKELAEFIEMAY